MPPMRVHPNIVGVANSALEPAQRAFYPVVGNIPTMGANPRMPRRYMKHIG
jgi:hypothetical protein